MLIHIRSTEFCWNDTDDPEVRSDRDEQVSSQKLCALALSVSWWLHENNIVETKVNMVTRKVPNPYEERTDL